MTYPQQQYPPQSAPPAPPGQQPWPGGYQQAPGTPASGGWPTPQPPAPPQQPAHQYEWNDNTDPARGGGVGPAARHLVGRTVIIVPQRVDETTQYGNPPQPRPTAYFDLYVVDGGPLEFGDSQERGKERPNTHRVATPAYFSNVMMGSSQIVAEVRAKLGKGISVGVIEQGTKGQRPYLVTSCGKDVNGNDRPDGEQRKALAQKLWFAHKDGSWTPPVAELINQAPAGYGVVGYGPPQQQQYPQQYPQQSAPPAPPGWGQQPQPSANAVPPNWDPTMWASFTPEQQADILARMQQPAAPPAAAPAGPPALPPGAAPSWP